MRFPARPPHSARLPRSEGRFGPGDAARAADCRHPGRCLSPRARAKTNPIEPIEVNSRCIKQMLQILINRTHWSYLAVIQVLAAKKNPKFENCVRSSSRTRIREARIELRGAAMPCRTGVLVRDAKRAKLECPLFSTI